MARVTKRPHALCWVLQEAAVRAQLQQLELALALPPGEVAATDADQISRRTALLRPKGDFVAHCLRPHLPAIRTLLSDGGELRKPSKLVLSGQQRGFRLPLTSPLAAAQQEHPRYKQNLMRARRMISRTVGISEEEAQEQFLSGGRAAGAGHVGHVVPQGWGQARGGHGPATLLAGFGPCPALLWLAQGACHHPSSCPTMPLWPSTRRGRWSRWRSGSALAR